MISWSSSEAEPVRIHGVDRDELVVEGELGCSLEGCLGMPSILTAQLQAISILKHSVQNRLSWSCRLVKYNGEK